MKDFKLLREVQDCDTLKNCVQLLSSTWNFKDLAHRDGKSNRAHFLKAWTSWDFVLFISLCRQSCLIQLNIQGFCGWSQ